MSKIKQEIYLLVHQTEIFVDPHGSPDLGAVDKFVTTDKEYLDKNDKYYQHDEEVNEDDLQSSEDGYNMTAEYYTVKKISKEKYDLYKEIIKQYNKI